MIKYLGALLILILLGGGIYYAVNRDTASSDPNKRYAIRGQSASYFEGAQGYYVAPSDEGDFPGVVLVHEWWGLNDQIKTQAEILATEGYRVLAVDLYNGRIAATSSEAMQLTQSLDQNKSIENLKAALKYLRDHDADRIGMVGWCFGGGQTMQLSLADVDLDATVIYYGNPVTDATQLRKIKWPLLGIFGAEDRSIASSTVTQFEQALNDADVDNQIYIYPGVGHAFANPTNVNGTYAPTEAADAWQKTTAFLREHLK